MGTMTQQKAGGRQGQLLLPVLAEMERRGGRAATRDLYEPVAEAVGAGPAERAARVRAGGGTVPAFERDVRWAQQAARLRGLARRAGPSDWVLTGRGRDALRSARPGIVVTVFETAAGVALWGCCEDALGHVDDGSVALLMTSPPYPLLREKDYGNVAEREYVDWLVRIAEGWGRKMTSDGSVVLNLGDAWLRGHPCLSLYQERLLVRLHEQLGYNLCARYAWHNPAKMPAPAEWVTVRRVRAKPSLESVLWLSRSKDPKADNRKVLVPYGESMLASIRAGGQRAARKPSGHGQAEGAFARDNGGAIPPTLITAPNTGHEAYTRLCRERGLPVHPARFPRALPEHFIRLTTDPGDLVADPFGGSFVTAAVAEDLGRRWVSCDRVLDYVMGGRTRFPHAAGA